MKLSSHEIRQKYFDYFQSKWHAVIPSASLIPENDPTTLFTWSGMQPMVPYLLGEKHPLGTRIVDSQKAFRAQDIDDIWDNRHTTFFEMLGNWSLGDYFKDEQTSWIWDFYVNELGLSPDKIYISVYRGNEKFGISQEEEFFTTMKKKTGGVELEYLKICQFENQEDQIVRCFGTLGNILGSMKNLNGKMIIVIQHVIVEDS